MHDRQSEDALNDDPLAREVERAVAVDPSAEFLARVRARVGQEPSRAARPWPFRWALVTSGLAVTVAVVAMLYPEIPWLEQGSGPRASQVAANAVAPTPAGSSESNGANRQEAVPVTNQSHAARMSAAAAPHGRSGSVGSPARDAWRFPEVIVSPAEADALRALIADAHSGRFTLGPSSDPIEVAPLSEPAVVAHEPTEIVIAPLAIQPLVKLSREELEGEVE